MDGADAARMAGAPGLQEVERLGTADLADRDAVGAQAQRRADEIGERGDTVRCPQRHQVQRRALQLAGVLDQNDSIARLCHLGEERVDQGGLAGRGAAGDQDVASFDHGPAQHVGLGRTHDPGGHVVVEGEDGNRGLADGKGRVPPRPAGSGPRSVRRSPAARPRPAALRAWTSAPDVVGDKPDDALAVGRRQPLTGVSEALGQPVDPEPTIWIEQHLQLIAGSSSQAAISRPERCAQHARSAGDRFVLS